MSAEADAAPDSIQLNFCQRCGISIPVSDIESGRATAAPGGFICLGCSYQESRDAAGSEPAAARRPAAQVPPQIQLPAEAASREGGVRILVAIALLYVVGATTFLLIREATRQPPVVDLTGVASADDFRGLSRNLEAVDTQSRQLLTGLQQRDAAQHTDLGKLQERLAKLEEFSQAQAEVSAKSYDGISKALLTLVDRTVGLKRSISDILDEVQRIRASAGTAAREPVKPAPEQEQPQPEKESEPIVEQPRKTPEEQARDREAQQYIKVLDDKGADGQERYDAAVNLGDLRHPDAIDPLTRALAQTKDTLLKRAAAWALGRHGKMAVRAIPTLIEEIGGKEAYVGYTCVDTLKRITKDALGAEASVGQEFDPTMSRSERKRVQKAWESWWAKNQKNLGA